MPIILISILVAFFSNYGSVLVLIEPLTYIKIDLGSYKNGYVSFNSFETTYMQNNEWWRLITPMFIHFSLTHLVFNCLWIYVLGSKIEQIDGHIIFINLVIFSSIISNLAQHFFGESALFGGLSGVIYGLLGYCMITEVDTKQERYDLPPALYLFMLIWLILGFLGILNLFGFVNVANYAYRGGLISGIIFAMITRYVFIRDINE